MTEFCHLPIRVETRRVPCESAAQHAPRLSIQSWDPRRHGAPILPTAPGSPVIILIFIVNDRILSWLPMGNYFFILTPFPFENVQLLFTWSPRWLCLAAPRDSGRPGWPPISLQYATLLHFGLINPNGRILSLNFGFVIIII